MNGFVKYASAVRSPVCMKASTAMPGTRVTSQCLRLGQAFFSSFQASSFASDSSTLRNAAHIAQVIAPSKSIPVVAIVTVIIRKQGL
ncbi:hypothetical protein [Rhizobium hidalgonense]|uniref:hypothetical protein n=1 Tax=Rhizobium hidalgonense TaxID=1538159 RepID=UPI0002EB6CD8|nr:hypothetical protein [Rhizobium hidalgonense]MDR9806324.1 hypothetical protein [Rhizobium hidalgonense]